MITNKQKYWNSTFIGLISSIIVVVFFNLEQFNTIDNLLFDSWFRLRTTQQTQSSEIVLVGIDDKTIEEYQWPISRKLYTQFFQKALKQQPAVIGFSILLADPKDKEIDQKLSQTIQQLDTVVMPIYYDFTTKKIIGQPLKEFSGKSLGNVATFTHSDGIVREMIAQVSQDSNNRTDKFWAYGIEIARLYLKQSSESVKIINDTLTLSPKHQIALSIKNNQPFIPLNFLGPPGTIKYHSFKDIMSGKANPDLTNKIVLLGSMAAGLSDLVASPYDGNMPMFGTELQAHFIQNLIENNSMKEASSLLISIFTILLGILFSLILQKNSFSIGLQFIVFLSFILFYLGGTYTAFSFINLKIPSSPFLINSTLIFLGILGNTIWQINRYFNEQLNVLGGLSLQKIHMSKEEKITQSLNFMTYLSHALFVRLWVVSKDKFVFVTGSAEHSNLESGFSLNYEQMMKVLMPNMMRKIPYTHVPEQLKSYLPEGGIDLLFLPMYQPSGDLEGFVELCFDEKEAEFPLQLMTELAQKVSYLRQQWQNKLDNQSQILPTNSENKLALLKSLTYQIRNERESFSAVLASASNPLFICDPYGEIRYYNHLFSDCLNLPSTQRLEGQNLLETMAPKFAVNRNQWIKLWRNNLSRRQPAEIRTEAGDKFYSLYLTPVIGENMMIDNVFGNIVDITDLYKDANYDGLTNLRNRKSFDNVLTEEINRAHRNSGISFALILCDVDHFKGFNDTYGHQVGDTVLKVVAECLQSAVRKTDFVARYGGEEMALILPMTDCYKAGVVAEKIRTSVERLRITDQDGEYTRPLTISLGVSTFDKSDTNMESILKRADEALYKCKDSGRNCSYYNDMGDFIAVQQLLEREEKRTFS